MQRKAKWVGFGLGFLLCSSSSIFIPTLAQNPYPEVTPGPSNSAAATGQNYTQAQAQALNLSNQALAPIQQSQWELAMTYLQQALSLDPNCAPALLNAGLCSNQLGRFDEGISYSSRVVQMSPERFEAWVNLGSSYQGVGKLAEAVQTYQEYLRRFPNEAHHTQVESLVKQLSQEVARQRTVDGSGGRMQLPGGGSVSTSENDYFAYSVPDSIMKWTPETLPVKVYIPADSEAQYVQGYSPQFGQALQAAFKEWADRSNGAVSYQLVATAQAADIDCRWVGDPSQVRTPAEGGDANILANVGRGLRHVTITLLIRPEMTNLAVATNTIYATALHEVGHSLGITGHSPAPNDIMFSSVTTATNPRHLTDRDVNTLAHLYRKDVKTGGQFQSATGDPKSDLSNQATNLMQQNDYVGATKKLEEALKIDPNFQVAKVNLAVCLTNSANQLAQQGKFNDAITHYKRALEMLRADNDPSRKALIMKNCAAMLYNTQRTHEAQEMEAAANRLMQGGR